MDARDEGPTILPARSQPLIAAAAALALVGIAAWYVVGAGHRGGLVHHDAPPPNAEHGFSVNLNTAGATELAQLPGLGPATAQSIVDHRREHGPFVSHEDLLDVPGIGPATLEQMRPYLRAIRRTGARPTADEER